MSQTRTIPVLLPAQSRPLVSASAEAASIPWTIWFMVAAPIITAIGGIWDFAWHFSIGRDTLWTPPHAVVQVGGIVAGVACVYTILTTTFAASSPVRDASVRVLGFQAPGGAFVALWGAVAVAVSVPFDNWWHNAYGLDVDVINPPHMLVFLGLSAIKIGALVWIVSMMNRAADALRDRLMWLFLFVGTLTVWQSSYMILQDTWINKMHSASCYLAVALFIPFWLITCGRGSGHKWGCTIAASFYTAIGLAAEWLLPLVPAQPKLGPVYHQITHLIPARFPLLLIVPAFVVDLLLQKLERRPVWFNAFCVGPAFLLSFLAVQWPFANFLVSPFSRNWVFGTAYFPYFDPAGFLYDPYEFVVEGTRGEFLLTMTIAFVAAILTTSLGLAWGNWMRRVRR